MTRKINLAPIEDPYLTFTVNQGATSQRHVQHTSDTTSSVNAEPSYAYVNDLSLHCVFLLQHYAHTNYP